MSNSISGRVVYVGPTTDVGKTNPFLVRTVIIVQGEDRGFPEYLRLDAQRENTQRLDAIKANDIIRATFFLKGQSEIKLDRNNAPTSMTSPVIASIEKIGEDPTGPIPDIVKPQAYQQGSQQQPMQNQGQTNQQWMDQQHAQQQGYQQQGYGAAPQQPAQQQGWGQAQAPQAAPQQGWPQPTQQQGPPPGTIPPTSSPV